METIFWEHNIEGEKVEFNSTPFIVFDIRKLDCLFKEEGSKAKLK